MAIHYNLHLLTCLSTLYAWSLKNWRIIKAIIKNNIYLLWCLRHHNKINTEKYSLSFPLGYSSLYGSWACVYAHPCLPASHYCQLTVTKKSMQHAVNALRHNMSALHIKTVSEVSILWSGVWTFATEAAISFSVLGLLQMCPQAHSPLHFLLWLGSFWSSCLSAKEK